MARGKSVGGIQIGTSFLVLIFVVLALVIFSVLSLMSSLSDQRLTEKNEMAVNAFYVADSMAEEKLATAARIISNVEKTVIGDATFKEELRRLFGSSYDATTGIVSYSVPISKSLSLFVELEVLYNGGTGNTNNNYRIVRWQEENIEEYEIDDSLHLWEGAQ